MVTGSNFKILDIEFTPYYESQLFRDWYKIYIYTYITYITGSEIQGGPPLSVKYES